MKNHLNSWREKFVHALFRHTCTLIACRNGEEQRVKVIGKNDFTLTKTVTILFVHERGNSVHASRGYAARSVPEFPRSWINNIVTITSGMSSSAFSCFQNLKYFPGVWRGEKLTYLNSWRDDHLVFETQDRKVLPPTRQQSRGLWKWNWRKKSVLGLYIWYRKWTLPNKFPAEFGYCVF